MEKPSSDIGQVYQTLGRAVTAGDDIYDAAYVGLASFGDALSGKYGVNLLDIDSLHMDEPWWNRMFVEDMTLEGHLFASLDYVSMMGYGYSNVLFFNQPLFVDRSLPMPYDQVREGTWTYDAMKTAMDAVVDLNGATAFVPTDQSSPALWGYAIQYQEDSIKMMNITLDTMTVDVGYLYGWSKDSVGRLATNIADGKDTFASSMKSAEKMVTRQMEKTLEGFGN